MVDRELIIDAKSGEVEIALLEDKVLVELQKEKSNQGFQVGDIYLGKVHKIMPGLNAAFVDVGYEKDAFLHYLDLGPQIRSLSKFIKLAMAGKGQKIPLEQFIAEEDIEKTGKISEPAGAGPDRKRTHLIQRPQDLLGNLLRGKVPGAGTVLQPDQRIHTDQIGGREEPAEKAYHQHQAQKLRGHHPDGCRRENGRGT